MCLGGRGFGFFPWVLLWVNCVFLAAVQSKNTCVLCQGSAHPPLENFPLEKVQSVVSYNYGNLSELQNAFWGSESKQMELWVRTFWRTYCRTTCAWNQSPPRTAGLAQHGCLPLIFFRPMCFPRRTASIHKAIWIWACFISSVWRSLISEGFK